jgi:XRE family transcriptional regulator, regulator of sulfur utilization
MGDPSPVKRAFGQAVRECRNAKNMTLEGLSLESGVGPKFVWQIANGLVGASVETLFKLAGALGVEPSDLIARSQTFLRG